MKKVAILGNSTERFTELAATLADEAVVSLIKIDDLALAIDGEQAQICDYASGQDLAEFDQILVLSTTPKHARNYILSALACYARRHQLTMYDDSFSNLDGKLYAMWRFWEKGVRVPKTAFGPVEFLGQKLAEWGGVGVFKAVNGTKGRDNYLVKTAAEIAKIKEQSPEIDFILQEFIPNDGDLRVLTIDYQPQLTIKRYGGEDHRNNTSLGGTAELVELPPEAGELAVAAARALEIRLAGADVIQHQETGEYYVIEVNRTPQLATGAFQAEKADLLKRLIRSK